MFRNRITGEKFGESARARIIGTGRGSKGDTERRRVRRGFRCWSVRVHDIKIRRRG